MEVVSMVANSALQSTQAIERPPANSYQLSRVPAEQRRLFATYPLFFRSVHYPEAYPLNIYLLGIQCGVGWYSVIEKAADEIERELEMLWARQAADAFESVAVIDRMLSYGTSLGVDEPFPLMPLCSSIHVVKGKLEIVIVDGLFGDKQSRDCIREAVQKAALRAQTVCECCGEAGLFREYWNHVYCSYCILPERVYSACPTN
jgi:hypothetical protein